MADKTPLLGSVSADKLLFFDCDCTLSGIEGVDELARLRGPDCFAQVHELSAAAMDGRVPIGGVFARRLDLIQPTAAMAEELGRLYIGAVEPTARATVAAAKAAGWTPVILSAGYTECIRPLAAMLGIAQVEAIGLRFGQDGSYLDFDRDSPMARNGGKPERIRQLKRDQAAKVAVMIGDGITDLETRDEVDLFAGFGRYVERDRVKAGAQAYLYSLADLLPLLP